MNRINHRMADSDRGRLDRITAEFSECDRAAAVYRITVLADSGFTEAQIASLTAWSIQDIRRALGERTA